MFRPRFRRPRHSLNPIYISRSCARNRGDRQNRDTAVGLFVFSKRTAPPEMESFNRYGLAEIAKSAETIKSGSDRILDRARIMSDGFAKQIAILNDKVGGLRETVGGS